MSYRKITVNDKQYEYVIGKSHTKVKGVALYKNCDIGSQLVDDASRPIPDNFIVTPKNVRAALLGEGIPTFTCEAHEVTTNFLAINPLESEIGNRIRYMINCKTCLDNLAGDI